MDSHDICFVSYGLYSYLKPGSSEDAGGAERQQYLIAKELVDRGYEVCAIVGDYGQEKHENIDGIDVWRAYRSVGKSGYKSFKGMIHLPVQIKSLAATIDKVDADAYYTRSTIYYPVLFMCSKLSNIEYYCGLSHDRDVELDYLNSKPRTFKYTYLMSLQNSNQVISQTKYQQKKLRENYNINSTIIRNGYKIPDYQERNPNYFLWVGRADQESKNPEAFLELASQLLDYKFVMIVAPGQNKEYYEKLKQRGQELDNVEFEGFVDPDDILQYYRDSFAIINTSVDEGFPNTFLEAWSVGTPVISLNVDLNGLIEQRNIGKYSGSFEQLVCDARKLAENNHLNSSMGKAGREYVISSHSIKEITDIFEEVVI